MLTTCSSLLLALVACWLCVYVCILKELNQQYKNGLENGMDILVIGSRLPMGGQLRGLVMDDRNSDRADGDDAAESAGP